MAGSSVQAEQPSAAASDGGLSGPDDIYVGKGRYIKGNKKMFPVRGVRCCCSSFAKH